MKQLWLSVLLKDTSAATNQAGIQTHILTTPELESNALDRLAMTSPRNSQIPNEFVYEDGELTPVRGAHFAP